MMKQITYYFDKSDFTGTETEKSCKIYDTPTLVKKVHIKTIPGVIFSLTDRSGHFVFSNDVGEYFFEDIEIGTIYLNNAKAIADFNGTVSPYFVITITEYE